MKILYFAWLREQIGIAEEEIDVTPMRVGELIDILRAKSDAHRLAFADHKAIRVAVNQKICDHETSLEHTSEVAFFPPMTGG